MTVLNTKGKRPSSRKASTDRTPVVALSHNGNPQFAKNEAFQLYDLIVSHFFGKDTYYESHDARLARLTTLTSNVVSSGNLHFIANAIVHARHYMNMRSMPLVLAVLFAKALRDQNKSYPELRQVVRDVIARADQINDMIAVALQIFGSKKAIPAAIKRGVADAFNKFNEYQFAKYNTSATVKFRDVLRIVHPKGSTPEQGAIFKRIMDDALKSANTWENQLSANGQMAEGEKRTKGQVWTDIVLSRKLGYMAMMRNLRNMWQEPDFSNEAKEAVHKFLADPAQVAKSKQFPFRFINAMDAVASFNDPKLTRTLSRALDGSVGNLPKLGQGVWIIVDCSGSMGSAHAPYGHKGPAPMAPIKTAAIFGAALAKANAEAKNVAITMFSDYAKHVTNLNTDDSVMSNADKMIKMVFGSGTNMQSALDMKSKLGFEPDTVIVISDMQVNQLQGSRTTNPARPGALFKEGTLLIALNLAAYESSPLSDVDGWYQLTGWSDRIFDFIPALREKVDIVDLFSYRYHGLPKKAVQQESVEKETE